MAQRNSCIHCRVSVPHTDTIGCCSGCGQCFASHSAFEAHFGPRGADGYRPCRDAATATRVVEGGEDVPVFAPSRHGRPGEPAVWGLWISDEQREALRLRLRMGRPAQEGPMSAQHAGFPGVSAPGGYPTTPEGPQGLREAHSA